jgi:hypothetical protein
MFFHLAWVMPKISLDLSRNTCCRCDQAWREGRTRDARELRGCVAEKALQERESSEFSA